MPTVFEVLLHAARNLDGLVEGTATADGTPTTLIDSHLGDDREDADFEGGSLFLTLLNQAGGYTSVTDEAVGKVTTSRTFYGRLLHTPIKPKSLTIAMSVNGTLIGSQTDDGAGRLSLLSASDMTNISMLAGAGPWSLQTGNVVPGSVVVTKTGATPDRLFYDDGQGYLVNALTGVKWATIDYDAGTVTLIVGQANLAALSLANLKYYVWFGSIDYGTGALMVRYPTAVTLEVEADYQYGYAAFFPLIVKVDAFDADTGTLTFLQASKNLRPLAGDTYAVMSHRYPRWLLFQKLNECLREIADYVTRTSTLASAIVNDQIAVLDTARVLRVMAGNADTTDRDWRIVTQYRQRGDVLELTEGVPYGADTIAVETLGTPPQVTSESAVISEWYSAEWLGLETAARCQRWRLGQPGADAQLITTLLNDLLRRAANAKSKMTAWRSAVIVWPQYPEY